MIKRILVSFLLAWLAIAPAIANSCAAACDAMSPAAVHQVESEQAEPRQSSGVPDCHDAQRTDQQDDTKMPDGGYMAVACFVAGAVSMSTSFVNGATIDIDREYHRFLLVPSASFETSPPNKPPQA